MNCEEYREHWHRRLDGLSHDSAADRHCTECSACRAYVAQMERLTDVLGELRRESESVGAERAAIADASVPRRRHRRSAGGWFRAVRIAASLAIVVGAVTYLSIPRASRERVDRPSPDGESTADADPGAAGQAGLGITLTGESADQYLAVAAKAENPRVQVYWLYPTLQPRGS